MSDTDTDIDTSKLTPANQNPWYILMTLYGEQEGDEIDWELHEKNRQAWNLWMLHRLSRDERKKYASIQRTEHVTDIEYRDFIKEISQKYIQVWAERNGDTLPPADIPRQKTCIDLSKIIFEKCCKFSKYIFLPQISFKSSVFKKKFCIDRSNFSSSAVFDKCLFFEEIEADISEFQKSVFFRGCNIESDLYFRNSHFRDSFLMISSTVRGNVWFYLTHFQNISMFDKSKFHGDIRFKGSEFDNIASFRNIEILNDFVINTVNFEECIFQRVITFDNSYFKSSYPIFTGSIFHANAVFSPREHLWPEYCTTYVDVAKISCATIRHLLTQQGLPEDAHFFFRREMHFAGQIGSFWQKLPYKIYGCFSDYGYSIKRPTLALLLLWLIGSIGLALGLADLRSATNFTASSFPASMVAAALSFSNLFPFFGFTGTYFEPGFMRELPAPLKVLSAAQTVLSLPLLFFLGLGLRTRFRMR